jgi:hypothetical protein
VDLDVELVSAAVAAGAAAYYFLRGRTVRQEDEPRPYSPVVVRGVTKPPGLAQARGEARSITLPDGSIGTAVISETGLATDFDPAILDDHGDALK